MSGIALMVQEHVLIKRMIAVVRRLCLKILDNEAVNYEDFYVVIDFIKNYADAHHHGKEENILFIMMMEELGPPAMKLVRHGMLVEHEWGRLHVKELEEAVARVLKGDQEARLDVVANAVGYGNLLSRHIYKEDSVAYKLAENKMSEASLRKLDEKCDDFEEEHQAVHEKYLKVVETLEALLLEA